MPIIDEDHPLATEMGGGASSVNQADAHAASSIAFAGLFATARRIGRTLVDIVYPPQCIGCRSAVADPSSLCPRCWSGMRFIERPYCERLGTPFELDLGGSLLSPEAIAEPPVFDRARSAVIYDGLGRALVHRLKYGDRLDLGLALARLMTLAGRDLIADADLIVPVPLHWTRLLRRRYNQAAILSQSISNLTGIPHDPLVLKRRKRTRPQYGLSRSERQINLQGALHVEDRIRIEGRRILVVDDVMTTNSTANAAARALLKAKASHVDVLSFARVVKNM